MPHQRPSRGRPSTHGPPIDVFLGAVDSDNDPLTYTIVSPPSDGALSGSSCEGPNGGQCVYTPDAGFLGSDSFTFSVTDDLGATSDPATFTIDVSANTAPAADDQSLFVFTDTPTQVTLNATDADGDFLTYEIVDPPDNGSLGDCGEGTCTYVPAVGYTGPDSFMWKATDAVDDPTSPRWR